MERGKGPTPPPPPKTQKTQKIRRPLLVDAIRTFASALTSNEKTNVSSFEAQLHEASGHESIGEVLIETYLHCSERIEENDDEME